MLWATYCILIATVTVSHTLNTNLFPRIGVFIFLIEDTKFNLTNHLN